jgi:hypothetical protein
MKNKNYFNALGKLDPTNDWKDNVELISTFWNHQYGRIDVTEDPIEKDTHLVTLITGGWSENEEVIMHLQQSWFWNVFWYASFRGGKYILHVRTIK